MEISSLMRYRPYFRYRFKCFLLLEKSQKSHFDLGRGTLHRDIVKCLSMVITTYKMFWPQCDKGKDSCRDLSSWNFSSSAFASLALTCSVLMLHLISPAPHHHLNFLLNALPGPLNMARRNARRWLVDTMSEKIIWDCIWNLLMFSF